MVLGIYYGIPAKKMELKNEDFVLIPTTAEDQTKMKAAVNELVGGFGYGVNRRKTIWSGARPVLDHGQHRYMFQVVGLSEKIDWDIDGKPVTKALVEQKMIDKVAVWGVWVGTFERKME